MLENWRAYMTWNQAIGRAAVLTAVGLVGLGISGAPAFAHVEIDADNVGAAGATITFNAEAESETAGIDGLRTFLPAGITPASVSLGSGPPGWKLTRTADGFTVSGQALRPKEAARYSVIIKALPQGVQRFSMKTVQHYSDGKVDRWIDETATDPEAPNAAPVLDLNPPQPPPVETITEPTAGVFGTSITTQTMLLGGGLAVAAVFAFFWIRTRMV
jgi:hypothetical protein